MKYPETWVETPIFDAGKISKATSDRSAMTSAVSKSRADAESIRAFLLEHGVTRPTAEQQRACDVAANKRKQGRKHVEAVMAGWASHRAARALPSKAEVEALEARCENWSVSPSSLNERGDAKVSFPETKETPEYVFKPHAEPIVIPGRCANIDCSNPIPPRMKEKGAKCCCKNCAQTVRRKRNALILADRVFAPKAPKPATVEHLTPAEYFENLVEVADFHAEWDARAAEDAAEAKREAEIDAMLEGLSKRVPLPVYTRRMTLENSRNP